jgi:hypothetical protein
MTEKNKKLITGSIFGANSKKNANRNLSSDLKIENRQ